MLSSQGCAGLCTALLLAFAAQMYQGRMRPTKCTLPKVHSAYRIGDSYTWNSYHSGATVWQIKLVMVHLSRRVYDVEGWEVSLRPSISSPLDISAPVRLSSAHVEIRDRNCWHYREVFIIQL